MKISPHPLTWHFDNSYARLPAHFFEQVNPTAVAAQRALVINHELSAELGIELNDQHIEELVGNRIPEGATPLAQAYAGHQFGHFTMLGDGRAVLLGEHLTQDRRRVDVQLKGSGPTPFSRRGDGRATVKAMLREYLISEAMHGLGIPTSRSLAVIATGEPVYRELTQPGAVLTRIMSSHIRVGTFEFAKRFLEAKDVQLLIDYVIQRHYPELGNSEHKAVDLFRAVMKKQINLIVHWMRVGFIHGVMNTDNMSICGETFDYGPCAFMNAYNPGTVFSSIDTQGRYAYGNQPFVAQWNLSVLASALLQFFHSDREQAIELAKSMLNDFMTDYNKAWNSMMAAKIGLVTTEPEDMDLVQDLLNWMQHNELDYTNTFLVIMRELPVTDRYHQSFFSNWLSRRTERLRQTGRSEDEALALMRTVNPLVIPRNHLVEEALDQAAMHGDFERFNGLLNFLKTPYTSQYGIEYYQIVPDNADRGYQTFCGT
jgi:serine/tyrosine/threonine adenylyltransferase